MNVEVSQAKKGSDPFSLPFFLLTKKGSDPFFLLTVAGFLYFLIVYILPPPSPIRPEAHMIEESWHLILTDGFLRGAQFGRDIIYTYGPWGFVESPQGNPRIYPWLLGARLLMALAFVVGTSWLAVRTIRPPVGRFFFAAWVALLSDPVYVLPAILFAVESFPNRGRNRLTASVVHLLAIACALTMWIKFTSFVTVASLAAALATQDLIKRRRPVIPLEILTAALLFWLLAGQSIVGLPAFLKGAVSTAMSYSTAMFLPGPYVELDFVIALLLAMAIPAAIILYYWKSWYLWPSLCWLGLLFFLQLKEAFVRYDSFHIWMGIVNALLPCTLILLCRAGCFNFGEASYPRAARVLVRVCAAGAILVSVLIPAMEIKSPAGLERFQVLMQNLASLQALASGRNLSSAYRQQLKEFRRIEPLSEVAGTADFFPDEQARLYGNSLRVRLPPIPQAFEAYNSYLSGQNASFFRGPHRPDFVFFDIAPIDSRYPSAADTLSWLALMDCYLPSGNSGRYLLLRAAGCSNTSLDLITETIARSGQVITVPAAADDTIWVEIDMRLNRAGSIIAALARPPDTLLSVRTETGKRYFNLSIDAGRTGFLLSPLLLDAASFGRLFVEGGADPRTVVRNLAIIRSDLAMRLYEPAIGVRLYRISRRRQLGKPA